ncbi:type II secretion system GspH family protein [Patescibacteria group bacterium]|nr:type II secretion system GspH family protein [Patescibacteria group bacterium]
MAKFKNQNGSTIIELLISLMVVGLVVTAIAVASTYSIKNTGEARFRQVASTLAQEVLEKSRNEKTRLGFASFSNAVGSNTYCFNTIPNTFAPLMPAPANCGPGDIVSLAGAEFTREVIFVTTASVVVTVEVNVSWSDSGNLRNVQLIQEFYPANQSF